MSSNQTPILTSNGPNEEKFQIPPHNLCSKICTIIFMIIWCVLAGVMCYLFSIKSGTTGILPGFFVLIGIIIMIVYCCKKDGTDVTINHINRTLKLEKTSCCCGGDSPKIIDLNQVVKMNIISQGIERRVISTGDNFPNRYENIPISSYIITYKNGMTEDVSNYFNYRNQDSLINCQNFLRKYINIEIGMPIYPQVVPGYNPNIGPLYNNYQQNYNANVNVYTNNNNGYNQNNSIPQNLPNQEEVSKPQLNDYCGTPTSQ